MLKKNKVLQVGTKDGWLLSLFRECYKINVLLPRKTPIDLSLKENKYDSSITRLVLLSNFELSLERSNVCFCISDSKTGELLFLKWWNGRDRHPIMALAGPPQWQYGLSDRSFLHSQNIDMHESNKASLCLLGLEELGFSKCSGLKGTRLL